MIYSEQYFTPIFTKKSENYTRFLRKYWNYTRKNTKRQQELQWAGRVIEGRRRKGKKSKVLSQCFNK